MPNVRLVLMSIRFHLEDFPPPLPEYVMDSKPISHVLPWRLFYKHYIRHPVN